MATAAPSRPRPGGGRLFIIIGLILALVAAGGVYLLGTLFGAGGGVIGGNTVTVVIAKQAIPVRHQLTSADLDTEKVSGNFAAVNTYAEPQAITSQGYIAEIQITKGSVITADMLAKDINLIPAGSAPAYLPLATGYVAMTIPTGEQQGVAGHITLGDYINIIASGAVTVFNSSGQPAAGPTKIVSKTVFTNVRIIGLGPAAPNVQPANGATTVGGTSSASGGVTSSLTIEVTQCNAEYFTWFLNNMQLKYTLSSYHDYGVAPTTFDPACKSITDAGGVTQSQVDAKYHFTTL